MRFSDLKSAWNMIGGFVLVLGLAVSLVSGEDASTVTAAGFDPNGVTFYLYRPETINEPYQLFPNNDTNLAASNFDCSLDTIVFTHGYLGDYSQPLPQLVKNAGLANTNRNIILTSYKPYNSPYLKLYQNGKNIGRTLASLINFLLTKGGLDISRLVIVGHSFGAHISGFAANYIYVPVLIIIGLDPAGPLFRDTLPSARLSTDDATYVDCFHTSPILGIHQSICVNNYYVNGGKDQPDCADAGDAEILYGGCSHAQAVKYYANTLTAPDAYPANKCISEFSAKTDSLCLRSNGHVFMRTQTTDRPTPGDYYVPVVKTVAN